LGTRKQNRGNTQRVDGLVIAQRQPFRGADGAHYLWAEQEAGRRQRHSGDTGSAQVNYLRTVFCVIGYCDLSTSSADRGRSEADADRTTCRSKTTAALVGGKDEVATDGDLRYIQIFESVVDQDGFLRRTGCAYDLTAECEDGGRSGGIWQEGRGGLVILKDTAV